MKYYIPRADDFSEVDVIPKNGKWSITIDHKTYAVDLTPLGDGLFSLVIDNRSYTVKARIDKKDVHILSNHRETTVRILDPRQKIESEIFGATEQEGSDGEIKAPMPGMVLRVEVKAGQRIEAGQPLLVMEAMKMENEIRAIDGGEIAEILVTPRQAVEKDDVLIRMKP